MWCEVLLILYEDFVRCIKYVMTSITYLYCIKKIISLGNIFSSIF